MLKSKVIYQIYELSEKGMSERKIATALNISRQTISKYKKKKITNERTKKIKLYKAITMQAGKFFDLNYLSLLSGCSKGYAGQLCTDLINKRLLKKNKNIQNFYKVIDQDEFFCFYMNSF